jgi:hypothetical protein
MHFDPKHNRRQLKSYEIEVFRSTAFAEAAQGGYLGNSAGLMLTSSLDCFLVGLFDEGREILNKAHTFLNASLERDEKGHPGRGFVLKSLALANWLRDGDEDKRSLRASVEYMELWFDNEGAPTTSEIQLSLALYLEAGELETLIRRFESAGLSKPKNIRRIKGEGTMAYVLALHRLGLEYTDDEVATALDMFLKRSVGEWMCGHYSTVARWMKIAHWKPGDDSIATVLRCYDYLPGLKPPKYPPN